MAQHHPDGKNDEVERIFYDFSLLRVYESDPQCIRERGVVDFGGETSNEADPLVQTTGIEELLKGSSRRLDIHIEKGGFYLRILVTNRFDQTERIGAADLGTVKVSNRFIPAAHALKKGYAFRKFPIGGTGEGPLKPKHFIKILGGDDILVSTVSIFRFSRGIKRIDSCSNDNGRNL